MGSRGDGIGGWEAALAAAREKPVVLVSGASGPDAAFVNGAYRLYDRGGGDAAASAPCFEEVQGSGRWLFLTQESTWCIGEATAKEQRQAVGWAHSSTAGIGQLPCAMGGWRVTTDDVWQDQELLVQAVVAEDAKAPAEEQAEAKAAGPAAALDPLACREPLCLVTECTGWDHAYEPLRFRFCSPAGDNPERQLQRLCFCLDHKASEAGPAAKRSPSHVACAFEVVSAERGFAWRLSADCPGEDELVLEPGPEEAVEALLGELASAGGHFCIVEPRGTLVTVSVELCVRRGPGTGGGLRARLWYERYGHAAQCTLSLPGESAERAAKTWCPHWWREWDREEQRRSRQQPRRSLVGAGPPTANGLKREAFTEEEALWHLDCCISFLTEPSVRSALWEARWKTSERFGLAETFPKLPPKAIELLGSMMEEALKRADCKGVHEFWDRFAAVAWLPSVRSASESLANLVETGVLPSEGSEATPQKVPFTFLREPRLPMGTRVGIRWQPGSEEAARMAFLEGRAGRLAFFDAREGRWAVVFEAHDGMLKVAPEHLRPLDGRVELAAQGRRRCDVCLGAFPAGRVLTAGCRSRHRHCQGCLRKHIKLPRLQRCTKCLLG